MKKTNTSAQKQLNFEIEFYNKILESRPNFVEVLKAQAENYTKQGDLRKGLLLDIKLSRLLPDDPNVFYNLSCSYSLLGRVERALATLRKSMDLGYDNIEWLMKDPDLKTLREDERFSNLIYLLK